ncbi:hypothetical protein PSDVSF_28420 [Pseudodesulfovibrio sediminis]|uniref:Uncharacterized protein n=1 Tax=Pseudodesulfovibrio sediminis TaxID=2810563 RepID=A0ABN6EWH8_9BACT|nr:hypothetical protein PSDVSF_28420 [Pseudodesulfovibrio sediminis]
MIAFLQGRDDFLATYFGGGEYAETYFFHEFSLERLTVVGACQYIFICVPRKWDMHTPATL